MSKGQAKLYTIGSETMTLREFEEKYKLNQFTILARIRGKWHIEDMFIPVGAKRKHKPARTRTIPQYWTKSSYECYINGCKCSTCHVVPDFFKSECHMKQAVFDLVKNYGVPEVIEGRGIYERVMGR